MLSSQVALSLLNWWQALWPSAPLYSFPPVCSGLEVHPWSSWPVRFLLLVILNWDQVLNWLGLPADVDSDGKNCHFEQYFGAGWLISKESVLVCTAERKGEETVERTWVKSPCQPLREMERDPIWFLLCPGLPWSGSIFAFDSRRYPSSLG